MNHCELEELADEQHSLTVQHQESIDCFRYFLILFLDSSGAERSVQFARYYCTLLDLLGNHGSGVSKVIYSLDVKSLKHIKASVHSGTYHKSW